MAKRKRKKSFEGLVVFLLFCILLTLLFLSALVAHQMGYLQELNLPDLPFLKQPESSASSEELPADAPDESLPQVKICYIDVGQGDSTLIVAPEATVLIDGGTPAQGSTIYDLLKEENIDRLDYVINTHPHSDHVGGLARVVRSLGSGNVGKVLVTEYPPELEPDIQSWPQFLETAEIMGAEIETAAPDTSYDLGGGATLTILGPTRLHDDMNNNSIVCRLDFGEASFLFAGDCGVDALRELSEQGSALEVDILKVGHHGSSSSTDSVVLRLTDPKAAVISCGAENDYGHPHREVTALLEERNIPCFRTDLQGDIWLTTDGQTIMARADHGQQEPWTVNAK